MAILEGLPAIMASLLHGGSGSGTGGALEGTAWSRQAPCHGHSSGSGHTEREERTRPQHLHVPGPPCRTAEAASGVCSHRPCPHCPWTPSITSSQHPGVRPFSPVTERSVRQAPVPGVGWLAQPVDGEGGCTLVGATLNLTPAPTWECVTFPQSVPISSVPCLSPSLVSLSICLQTPRPGASAGLSCDLILSLSLLPQWPELDSRLPFYQPHSHPWQRVPAQSPGTMATHCPGSKSGPSHGQRSGSLELKGTHLRPFAGH